MDRREHWEWIYRTRGDTELSWFQAQPSVSLSLIESLRPKPRRVIDVGGGQSPLAGELLGRGVEDVTVLDISESAIERGRERLGPRADQVRWIVGDVLEPQDVGDFDLWHDRAVFHFLIEPEDRRRYVAAARRAVCKRGHAIVATFGLTGPEMCSGLPVRRYDAARFASEFGPSLRLVGSANESHTTCGGRRRTSRMLSFASRDRGGFAIGSESWGVLGSRFPRAGRRSKWGGFPPCSPSEILRGVISFV